MTAGPSPSTRADGHDGRLIAIGDIHGCLRPLEGLLAAIAPTPQDTLVLLGDYVDRGPDSRGVVQLLLELSQRLSLVCLLGNHEEMLWQVRLRMLPMALWMDWGGRETLASYGYRGRNAPAAKQLDDLIPPQHWEFFTSLRPAWESADHFFVHANYDPALPLDRQPPWLSRWASLREHPPRPHASGKTAIVGHTSQPSGQVLDLGFLKCIDTYCYGGQWLTALEVATGRLWQADPRGNVRRGQLDSRAT